MITGRNALSFGSTKPQSVCPLEERNSLVSTGCSTDLWPFFSAMVPGRLSDAVRIMHRAVLFASTGPASQSNVPPGPRRREVVGADVTWSRIRDNNIAFIQIKFPYLRGDYKYHLEVVYILLHR